MKGTYKQACSQANKSGKKSGGRGGRRHFERYKGTHYPSSARTHGG